LIIAAPLGCESSWITKVKSKASSKLKKLIMKKYIYTSLLSTLITTLAAWAHGSMADPCSRVYKIFLEGPETPQTEYARAAIAVAGTQAFYDWNEVNLRVPSGHYQAVIPDGMLPGVGRDKYAGLNLARVDWPATKVVPGPRLCRFYSPTPHDPSTFKAFITRDGYDPRQILRWSDLVEIVGGATAQPSGDLNYYMTLQIPTRVGRHILYVVWQRIDPAGEIFVSTSDLDFGGVDYGNPVVSTVQANATFALTSQWTGGGQATIRITNNTTQPILNWTLAINWSAQIHSLWNGVIVSQSGNSYLVKNADYNPQIEPGSFVEVGCTANFSVASSQPSGLVATGSVATLPPTITSATTASATVGESFLYTILASGNPVSYLATGVPEGLVLNTQSGQISGSPIAAGNFSLVLRATNASGSSTSPLTLTVDGCFGDGNRDGAVNAGDMAELLLSFGEQSIYDLDLSGVTDLGDLALLFLYWGSC